MEEVKLRVLIEIRTKKPMAVKVYLDEILKQIASNDHFLISDYRISIGN